MRGRPTRTTAATPASAKSPGRRAISTKPQPGGWAGTSIAVRISSASSAVVSRPRKNASAATSRAPRGPVICTRASRASSAAGSSAAGSACARLPPSVPWFRIAAWPTWRAASARSGARSITAGEAASSAWRVSAPMRSPPSAVGVMPVELAQRR